MDNFNFILASVFHGYDSCTDKTKLAAGWLVRGSKNVFKKLSGTIAVRWGLKRRGTANATLAGVPSAYVWNTSLGAQRHVRVTEEDKLQVESDIADGSTLVWYDLMTSLDTTRFVLKPWWDDSLKKDKLIFVKHDDNLYSWEGGIGVISSTTINTIVLTATIASQGFDTTSGSVLINGTTYTYSGSSGSTLTGVSADPRGEANGSVAISTVVTTSNSPAADFINDFINIIGNRLHVGSYTSRLVYISDQADFTDFTVPTPRIPGSPELLTLDNTATCISVRNGNAHISAYASDWYEISYSAVTVGTTLTEVTKVDKKPVSYLSAALAHEFVAEVGNDIIYLAQDQQVRIFGTFRNIIQAKYPSLSQPVQSEFAEEDFTGGHLVTVGDFIRITAPVNGRDWMHQTRELVDQNGNIVAERLWHPPQVRNITRFVVIEGIEYGHSNANPQVYQIENTDQWHDDGPDDEPLPYSAVMRMAYHNASELKGGTRMVLESFDKTAFEGYMTLGTNLYANMYLDYQGSTDLQQVQINTPAKPAKFFYSNSPASLGDSSMGDNPLGDGLTPESNDQELLPKFRSIRTVGPKNVFEHELEVFSSDVDSRWEILALGTNMHGPLQGELPTFLSK